MYTMEKVAYGQVLSHAFLQCRSATNLQYMHLFDVASSDETVQILTYPENAQLSKPIPPIVHLKPVKAILPLSLSPLAEPILLTGSGDVIRVYDVSSPEEPELLGEVDGHWHDILALKLWLRQRKEEKSGKMTIEPWIVSTSLDGTIRRWRLKGQVYFLLN